MKRTQLIAATTLMAFASTAFGMAVLNAGGDYSIGWFTIDGGGGTSAGGNFSLSGTIGQHDAGPAMAGGNFALAGGFWAGGGPQSGIPADLLNFDIILGTHLAGDIDSLRDNDNDTLDINSNFGFNSSEPNLFIMRVDADTDLSNPSTLHLSITSRTSQNGTTGKVALRNWNTGVDDAVAEFPRGSTEMTHSQTGLDASLYARNSDGLIRMTHKHIALIVFSSNGFDSFIDQIEVVVDG